VHSDTGIPGGGVDRKPDKTDIMKVNADVFFLFDFQKSLKTALFSGKLSLA
jgi:hypothetical protein